MLIDSHSHFDDDSFAHDRAAVLERAHAAGITKQIVPAVTASSWPRLHALCQHYAGLYPAYGLHPLYAHTPADLTQLEQWLPRGVGVGECGLDYYVEGADKAQQASYFSTQLHLARDAHLPVIIHARRAVEDVIQIIRKVPGSYGVVHSFSGSLPQAQRLLDLGFYLSFGGPITYPRAHKLRCLVQSLPLASLLLETDAPDQPLATHRAERNEPAYLIEILHTLASLRQQEPAEIARITTQNALQLFKISPL